MAALSLPDMTDMISYQAPVNALPSAGLALRVSVLTTIKSMISPGIWLESNTSWLSGVARISLSSGFQVTTAVTSGEDQAATMSASEVLTTVMSFSLKPMLARPRASR